MIRKYLYIVRAYFYIDFLSKCMTLSLPHSFRIESAANMLTLSLCFDDNLWR